MLESVIEPQLSTLYVEKVYYSGMAS